MNWRFLKRSNTLIILAVLTTALALGAIFYVKGKTEVVASVNGEKITKTELYDLMVKQSGQEALDALISERIVQLEAKKQTIVVPQQDIQTELEKYYTNYGGQEAFLQTLANSGYTLDDVKKDLELSLKIRKLMEPRISISEDEIKTYFEENKDSFALEKQVKASHILVDTQEKATEIKKRLANGEDFAGLAKENSTDTATMDNGGELGFFAKGEMAKEFETAAFALKVGEISAPVKTEFGYHIIKVEEIKEAQVANYEQSKDSVYQTLFDQKVETEFSTWLQEMQQQYKINNFLTNQ
ncbi:MAG: peptidylprolyl isomerase [Syntrophomonas sp.]